MLERAAASLEPCNLQRVLSPSSTSLKSRQRLSTAFWQHGAVDIELSNVWQMLLVREPLESLNTIPPSQQSRAEPLTASTFLLDFLYPQGATSLLRKLSPSVLGNYERPRPYLRGGVPRLFTSSASSSRQSQSPTAETETAIEDALTGHMPSFQEEDLDETYQDEDDDRQAFGMTEQPTSSRAPLPTSKEIPFPQRLQRLRELLQKGDEGDFYRIWEVYHATQLDEVPDGRELRNQFLDYATKFQSMSQLIALAIKTSQYPTVWHVWARFPNAQRDDVKALDWEQIESILSTEALGKGLLDLITHIQKPRASPYTDTELSKSLLNRTIYPCIRRYMQKYDQKQYVPILRRLKDPLLYEDFIRHVTVTRQKDVATKLYRDYRKLPDVKIRGQIMRFMIKYVFLPNDAVGMEMVLEDCFKRFPKLDLFMYRAYMEFYARQGDVKSVRRLWGEFTSYYPKRFHYSGSVKKPDFLPLLHVHAVRGELYEVRQVFTTMQGHYGADLSIVCWNILLNAHAKSGEYDAAIRVFGVLKQTCEPDQYSYGTMMGMSGSRGDLEFTLELYRMAKFDGVTPSATMIDCVMEAYCQNDRYGDAESICTMTTKAGRFKPGECTIMWNTLLYHHAQRRDLTNINRILLAMTEQNVPYNAETYEHLLQGLALCKQPHHALYLLNTAVRDHTFKPTQEHYALLMSAYIRTGAANEALRTSTMLRSLGIPKGGSVLLRVFKALGALATHPADDVDDAQRGLLVSALRQFRESIEAGQRPRKVKISPDVWIEHSPNPDTVTGRTNQAAVLIFLFTQMKETIGVGDILQLWRSSSPETSKMQEPPGRLLEALMLSAFYDGNYDEVQNIWGMFFDRTREKSGVAAPGTSREDPLPNSRYSLNNALKTMQRMYAAQNDADGLRNVVDSVLKAGFRLDSKNWNYYVQLMAGLKKWREAFMVCEERLMPSWMGWQSVRRKLGNVKTGLPLELRRQGSNPRHLRPVTYTLAILAKSYMDLEQMALWSSEADRLLNYILEKCPGVMAAVKTLLREGGSLGQKVSSMGEDSRKEQEATGRKKREKQFEQDADEDMPQAFRDMMTMAHGGEGRSVQQESWGDEDEQDDGRDADGDGKWYDVDADDPDWAPMKPGQKHWNSEELQAAEEKVFGADSFPKVEEHEAKASERSKSDGKT